MPLAGVIFDFDGVLADTERLHLTAYQQVLETTELSLTADDYYARYLGYDDVGVFSALAKDQGVTLGREALARLVAEKGRRFETGVGDEDVLFPDAATCIERLAVTVPLAIASGALHHEIEAILAHAGIRRHFRAIVAADDVDRPKPAPDSYLKAAALLRDAIGAATDPCLVAVEDSRWGIEAARAAGLRCVGLTTSYPAEELGPVDALVSTLADLDEPLLDGLCRRSAGVALAAPD